MMDRRAHHHPPAARAFELSRGGDGSHQDPVALQVQVDNLRQALASRPVIEQAKGALMLQYRIDAQTAFAVLVRLSQQTNIKVHDLAVTICKVVAGDHQSTDVGLAPVLAQLLDQLGPEEPCRWRAEPGDVPCSADATPASLSDRGQGP